MIKIQQLEEKEKYKSCKKWREGKYIDYPSGRQWREGYCADVELSIKVIKKIE